MSTLRDFAPYGWNTVGQTFIETGLLHGASLREAARQPFARLHSIEIFEPHVVRGRRAFAHDPRVTIHLGASPDVIPDIVDPTAATTFFLDGHYSGGKHEEEEEPIWGECPLLAELDAINSIPWRVRPVVIIDDWSMLLRPWDERLLTHFDQAQWPLLSEVDAKLMGYESVVGNQDLIYYFPPGWVRLKPWSGAILTTQRRR